MNRSYQ